MLFLLCARQRHPVLNLIKPQVNSPQLLLYPPPPPALSAGHCIVYSDTVS